VRYLCEGGLSLSAAFDDRDGTVQLRTGWDEPIQLDRVRSNRGFRYESRARRFYGRGQEATYVVGRRAPIECRLR